MGETVAQTQPQDERPQDKARFVCRGLTVPFILLAVCFAVWGSAANLTDVMVGVQAHLRRSNARSALLRPRSTARTSRSRSPRPSSTAVGSRRRADRAGMAAVGGLLFPARSARSRSSDPSRAAAGLSILRWSLDSLAASCSFLCGLSLGRVMSRRRSRRPSRSRSFPEHRVTDLRGQPRALPGVVPAWAGRAHGPPAHRRPRCIHSDRVRVADGRAVADGARRRRLGAPAPRAPPPPQRRRTDRLDARSSIQATFPLFKGL